MNKLAYWRATRCLTVRELARRAELNPATVSRIEKGRVRAYLSTLGRLAAALDIDVRELIELVDDTEEAKDPPRASGQAA